MQFASIGSGSKGNATLVESGKTLLMVDCGFSCKETERRLTALGRTPGQLTAILVTHEHGDHVRGVAALARKYQLPVWLTRGTCLAMQDSELPEVHYFSGHDDFTIDDLYILPFTVPHDAREPCQFLFDDGNHRFGVLTDTGRITSHICDRLDGCNALLLECNHDPDMLARGPYSASLKQRVGGPHGHLSNHQAGELLERIDTSHLQHVIAAHLSEQNNRAALATAELAAALDCKPDWIGVADQAAGLDWRSLS